MFVLRFFQKILKWCILLFFGTSIFFVVLYRWMPVPVTPLMIIRCVQQVTDGRKIGLHHHWVDRSAISPCLPLAVIASEDQRFLQHHGFDFTEIGKALDERKEGKRNRGASTISQQTAKNVFLYPGHSWVRKGLEVYFTALIELVWGKERIMEVYLNSIEMGDGIYGAEAVSQLHFNTSAKDLTKNQSALIAATLPNPLRFSSKHPSNYMYRRQYAIMRQMRNLGKPEQNLFSSDKEKP